MSGLFLGNAGDVRPTLFRIFFFVTFAFLLYQFFRLLSPFFDGIVVAVTLALIFYPLHARILRLCRNRPNLSASLSVTTLFLIVVVPTIFFLALLGKQAAAIYPWAQGQIQHVRQNPQEAIVEKLPAPARRAWNRVQLTLADAEINAQDVILKNIERLGAQISLTLAAILRNLVFFIFQTMVMLFTLFFLFRDGAGTARKLIALVPMEASHKEHILLRLNQTLTAVVRGMFITAAVQGLLGGIGYAVAGLRFSVLLGFLTAFLALIPMVGATAVWLPVGIYMILKGWMVPGILLLIWGGGVVSMVDNFLRPYLIGERAKLPVVLLFFGTLGGLHAYGPIGLFAGPVMVATVLAFSKIYGEQLQRAPESAPLLTPPPTA